MSDLRANLIANLAAFAKKSLREAALSLFKSLGYQSDRTLDFGDSSPAAFWRFIQDNQKDKDFDRTKALFSDWKSADFLFQLTDQELSQEDTLFKETDIQPSLLKSYVFFAIDLNGKSAVNGTYARGKLTAITRQINRVFPMPVMLLIRHGAASGSPVLSIAVINRRQNKVHTDKDVLEKVTLIRDISLASPHRGHLDILASLALPNLVHPRRLPINNFDALHATWEEIFNVELLNKRFYNRLVEWYDKCLSDIQINLAAASCILGKDVDNELKPQAVIRVIIRLLFIWFMKEKRLLDERFFTRTFAFEFVKKENGYYNAILQNLFFAVLNRKISERRFRNEDPKNKYDPDKNDYGIFDIFRHKTFFNPEKAAEFLAFTKTIPFVNGGLFVCHDYKFAGKDIATNQRNIKQNYIIDGFSDNPKDCTTISDSIIFELLDLFSDYVFTIEESTPLEQEIALDPELLGTVFENLIGSYNPETKENARKQTGSFYTPREIVDYMCRESLKQHLTTTLTNSDVGLHADHITALLDNHEDQLGFPQKAAVIEAITSLKILDPACGSGAFPMGMFLLMVRTIEKLQEHKTTYQNKLDIITNCIYGVDVQNIAVEITKLRFFISLLVDYPALDKPENFEVLPNLETKFVVANTLVGIDLPKQRDLFDLDAAFEGLTKIFLPFTTAKTPKEKEKIKNNFSLKKEEIINSPNFEFGDAKEKIRAWNPFNICHCSPFFDSCIMFGITAGFDIVIGNPPYVHLEDMKEVAAALYKPLKFETYEPRGDLYALFYERGYQLLRDNAHLCFITSNKWMRAGYGESLRKFFFQKTRPKILIDFAGQKIFDSATVDTNILLFQKAARASCDTDSKPAEQNAQPTFAAIGTSDCRENLSLFVQQHAIPCVFPRDGSSWVILSSIEQSIKAKIEKIGIPLKDWDISINYGIKTGCNEAFIIDEGKRAEILANCKTDDERKRTDALIRPILRGRDIKRYRYNWAGLYLVGTHNGILEKGSPKIDIKKYSTIKRHLDSYWNQIESRSDQGDTPYHLRSCAYWDDFSKPKIVWAELARTGNAFTFDGENRFVGNTGYILTMSKKSEDNIGYELLLAFLNSKTILFYLDIICSRFDENGWRWLRQFVELLPVPQIEKSKHNKLIKLVASELQTKTIAGQMKIEEFVEDCFKFNELERKYLKDNILPE